MAMTYIGGPRIRADRAGWAIAMFLGTISPTVIWKNTTRAMATTNATGCTNDSGTRAQAKTGSSEWAMAGSAIAPRPSEHIVMPNWAPAIISVTFSIARRVNRAPGFPAEAASSMAVRRTETSANSAPTKKALANNSARAIRKAVVLVMPDPPGPRQ